MLPNTLQLKYKYPLKLLIKKRPFYHLTFTESISSICLYLLAFTPWLQTLQHFLQCRLSSTSYSGFIIKSTIFTASSTNLYLLDIITHSYKKKEPTANAIDPLILYLPRKS